MNTNKIILSILTAGFIASECYAGGAAAGGATEWTQIANNVELGSQYSQQLKEYALQMNQYQQQVQQYVNQYQSYQAMLQNIGQLPDAQWNDFQSSVNGLRNIMDQAGRVSYISSSLDSQFNSLYKGYNQYLNEANGGSLQPSQVYQEISEETRQTVNGSLKALNLSQNDLEDDVTTMRQLQTLSTSAAGQKAAIQAANEIALHQTAQLKRMHQTLLVQSQAQMKAVAAEQAKEDAIRADIEASYSPFADEIDDTNNQPAGGRGL